MEDHTEEAEGLCEVTLVLRHQPLSQERTPVRPEGAHFKGCAIWPSQCVLQILTWHPLTLPTPASISQDVGLLGE